MGGRQQEEMKLAHTESIEERYSITPRGPSKQCLTRAGIVPVVPKPLLAWVLTLVTRSLD